MNNVFSQQHQGDIGNTTCPLGLLHYGGRVGKKRYGREAR